MVMAENIEINGNNGGEIFQTSSPEVRNYYNNFRNIMVIDEPEPESRLCVIYFSSNELYYPNTKAAFDYSVVSRDKYEWLRTKFGGAARHIFVRDIQKQWYIEGVNSDLCTPELLCNELKSLSDGMKIFAIGSSAGGFAAILFGSLLNAERVYAFNAQLNLNLIVKGSTRNIDPLLFKYTQYPERSKYFLVDNFINNTTKYFYFQSAKSGFDQEQFKGCKRREELTRIQFITSNHGFPFLRHDLQYVLSLDEKGLYEMASKTRHPILFSLHNHGVIKGIYLVIDSVITRIRKKRQEKLNK